MFYRVLRDWNDRSDQIGTFTLPGNAILQAQLNPGYKVFDEAGKQIYPEESGTETYPKVKSFVAG